MAKIIKCPSCGASDYEKTDETHYRCNFCESKFVLEEKNRQTDVSDALNQFYSRKAQYVNSGTPLKSGRPFVMLSLVIMLLSVGVGVFVAFNNSSVNNQKSAPGQIQEDSYWGNSSVLKFNVFEGSKGPVVWMILNQSSKKLDSARYTLQLLDPIKKKIIFEKVFATMTWKQGFDFNNYLSEMVSYSDKVYFLSDASGLEVYDLYSGKKLTNNENFAAIDDRLKNGIVSAKNKYYKDAIELITGDGYKFLFLPKFDKLVTEEQFNDYKKVTGITGSFAFLGETRMKLYYVISEQDTLRNDYSFSAYYLERYLKNASNRNAREKAFQVDTASVFFNINFLYRSKHQTVFTSTSGMDKKSEAYLISYSSEDFTKPLWKISLKKIKGFENAIEEGYYMRTHAGGTELAVWYESAEKKCFAIDLKSGMVNWNYILK